MIPFEGNQQEWSKYSERLEHYFIVNDITAEAKRRVILLNGVGPAMYSLVKTLVSPTKATELALEEIVTRAKKHFNPKPSPIVKGYAFNTTRHTEGKTVGMFTAELSKIAEDCKYGVTRCGTLWFVVSTTSISNSTYNKNLI